VDGKETSRTDAGAPFAQRRHGSIGAPVARVTSSDAPTDGAALEIIAQDAWWRDDAAACLGAREAAYRTYRDARDVRGAARAATALGYDAALFGQGLVIARSWLARARDLLAEQPETWVEHGWLGIREAELILNVVHQPDAALSAAETAHDIGVRLQDPDLVAVGGALVGAALARGGDLAGLSRLNAAAVGALAGDVDDIMWAGKICCWAIAAAHDAGDLEGAREWCDRVEQVSSSRGLAPLFDACRIMHASVQIEGGRWIEAERELVATLQRLAQSRRASRIDAIVGLGELRRRQGRREEAEDFLARAEFDPRAIIGRALISLEKGDGAAASHALETLLDGVAPRDAMLRARVLRAVVRCAVETGRIETARVAAGELRDIADRVGSSAWRAVSAEAAARLTTDRQLLPRWLDAIRLFDEAGLPFDEAEARMELATALRVADPEGSRRQATSAARLFTELGAPKRAIEASGLAQVSPETARLLTPRERDVLRLVAAGLTNGEIAEHLVVSGHTVHRHVANILSKLAVPTRAAAVSIATQQGLL
jgi:ATP/maltotriose-dependent transcriptional regulator MalT